MNGLTLPQQIARIDSDRLRRYQEHLAFYQGHQWPEPSRRRRRLTFNYAKAIVEKATSYLMHGVGFALDAADDSPQAQERARRAKSVLQQAYDANNLAQLDFDTELDCAILGDAAYKVIWDPAQRQVRVSAPDVQGLFVWWLGDDVGRIWRLASRYTLTAEEVEMLYGHLMGSPEGRA
ncbi:MAG: phage portal protein, partial [Dehalococcoidia bacterium]